MRRRSGVGVAWRSLAVAVGLWLMVGCGERPPVPRETMVAVLADMYLVDALVDDCDSLASQVHGGQLAPYQEVLARYGLTPALLDSAMEFYLTRRGAYDALLGDVITRLQVQQQALADSVQNGEMIDEADQ